MGENHVNTYIAGAKSGRDSIRTIGGQLKHYVVTLSGQAVTIPDEYRGCRWIECDSDGVIRFAYGGDNGVPKTETKPLVAGQIHRANDVITVYPTYGTTPANCDTQVYNDAGDIVTGIKLYY
jgi:hypothetical protein